MTEVVRSGDCGNSPKNVFVETLAVALATGDRDVVAASIVDDAQWRVVGHEPVQGKGGIAAALRADGKRKAKRLVIDRAMTHGRAGAVNGTVEFSGGKICEFCDVYEFGSAKGNSVSRITSYRVER